MMSVRSRGTVFSSLSRKHGLTCVPPAHVAVEAIIIAIGGIISAENVLTASRMNRKVVFVLQESMVASVVESGLSVEPDIFILVSPLDSSSVKVIISHTPPYLENEAIECALRPYGTVVFRSSMVPLRCRDDYLKHVYSFRRQLFMVLNENRRDLDVSFTIKHDNYNQMYATTQVLTCYACNQYGHLRKDCPGNPLRLIFD